MIHIYIDDILAFQLLIISLSMILSFNQIMNTFLWSHSVDCQHQNIYYTRVHKCNILKVLIQLIQTWKILRMKGYAIYHFTNHILGQLVEISYLFDSSVTSLYLFTLRLIAIL